jgi:hypothetical protein
MKTTNPAVALAVCNILNIIAELPDEVTRQECLTMVLDGRCRTCLEESPPPRWCCYDSRGD